MAKKKKIEKEEKIAEIKRGKANFWNDNKGIIITIAVIVGAIIIGLLIYKFSHSFEYNGVPFVKRYYGNILLYTAKIPVADYYGNIIEYRLVDFRNDPRELNENVQLGQNLTIKFLDSGTTYLSFLENKLNCENNGLASANFAIFLRDILKIKYKAGLANETEAIEANVSYITCENAAFNTVIYIHAGNKTKITKRISSCYDIEFNDCKILEALERFELKVLEQYMAGLTN